MEQKLGGSLHLVGDSKPPCLHIWQKQQLFIIELRKTLDML